jgi:hypothetical protein
MNTDNPRENWLNTPAHELMLACVGLPLALVLFNFAVATFHTHKNWDAGHNNPAPVMLLCRKRSRRREDCEEIPIEAGELTITIKRN